MNQKSLFAKKQNPTQRHCILLTFYLTVFSFSCVLIFEKDFLFKNDLSVHRIRVFPLSSPLPWESEERVIVEAPQMIDVAIHQSAKSSFLTANQSRILLINVKYKLWAHVPFLTHGVPTPLYFYTLTVAYRNLLFYSCSSPKLCVL